MSEAEPVVSMATQTKTQSQAPSTTSDTLGAIMKESGDGAMSMLNQAQEEEEGEEEPGMLMSNLYSSTAVRLYTHPIKDWMPALDRRPQVGMAVVPDGRKGGEFLCGWGAAFINITTTFPINKAIFRQQLLGISGYRALGQLKNEGLRNLYRGLLPPLMLKTTTMSVMFGSYKKFQLGMDNAFPTVPRPVNHAAAAMMAGTLEMTLTPFERIQTLLQDRTYHQRFNNSIHAAKELWAFGFKEYYRGGTIILLRNGPSNVFFFLGKEYVNDNFPSREDDSKHIVKDFICGACLGALISTGFFPFNVVKTRMQSNLGGPFHGIRHSFQQVWVERNRSLSGLFRGLHLNYTRSFISWGIINASYEYLLRLYRQVEAGGRL